MSDDRWHLTLNRYQRDNLLELFHACGYPAGGGNVPERVLTGLHTGDWMGELYWQLAPPTGTEVDDVDEVRCLSLLTLSVVGELRPNASAADQVARVERDASGH